VVGWALIPSMRPGSGLNGQGFVSLSGGGARMINPHTKHPKDALLNFVSRGARLGFYLFVVLVGCYFALPMAWLALAPFNRTPTLAATLSHPTLANFREVLGDPGVLTSLRNSALLALYTMVVVVAAATLAAYALSRVRLPGRDLLLYVLLLFSSVVSGTAAMVPLFLLMFDLHLIDTYLGVTLALTGGLLPAAIFVLGDDRDRRARRHPGAAGRARRGHGVPGLPPLPAHDRGGQHRLPAEGQARGQGRAAPPRGRDRLQPGARRDHAATARPALRRPAAARGAGQGGRPPCT